MYPHNPLSKTFNCRPTNYKKLEKSSSFSRFLHPCMHPRKRGSRSPTKKRWFLKKFRKIPQTDVKNFLRNPNLERFLVPPKKNLKNTNTGCFFRLSTLKAWSHPTESPLSTPTGQLICVNFLHPTTKLFSILRFHRNYTIKTD